MSTKKAEVLSQVVSRHHTQRDEIYYAVRMDTVTMSKNPNDHKDQKLKKVPSVDRGVTLFVFWYPELNLPLLLF